MSNTKPTQPAITDEELEQIRIKFHEADKALTALRQAVDPHRLVSPGATVRIDVMNTMLQESWQIWFAQTQASVLKAGTK